VPGPRIGGERGGALQCRGSGAEAAASSCTGGAFLQHVGHGVIWPGQGGCLVPCPAVRVGCAGQRPVHLCPLGKRRALVHGGPDKRVAEAHLGGGDAEQAGGLGSVDVCSLYSQVPGGGQHDGRIGRAVRGGEQQQPLAGYGQGADAGEERVLQRQGEWNRQAAVNLARYARQVTIVIRGDSLAARMSHYLIDEINATSNIDVRSTTQIAAAEGTSQLEALTLKDTKTGSTQTVPASALVVLIGAVPHTDWLSPSAEN
jgi:Pyridine nucleotide-disulphide oxidoreductase